MSRINGEKARTALQLRRRAAMRLKTRELRREFIANPPKPAPPKAPRKRKPVVEAATPEVAPAPPSKKKEKGAAKAASATPQAAPPAAAEAKPRPARKKQAE
jgi:hypothetical protein